METSGGPEKGVVLKAELGLELAAIGTSQLNYP